MQLGFVIDHGRCIGCHACTVACKAENDVALGKFRTWVKYTERGEFPSVKRSFAVLRCNQCTDAPCVTICPVRALHKRPDGIVDIDPAACIGCKACMQGCPYDALYIDPTTRVAEKCHFCAHRTEIGLAPACAVVCPTEAIIPGDFHDPGSRVAQMVEEGGLTRRKTEAGTGPNVHYVEAAEDGLDPLATDASGGYLWANRMPGTDLSAEGVERSLEDAEDRARTTYDVDHPPLWGARVSGYLLTKSFAAGLFVASAYRYWFGAGDAVNSMRQSMALAGWALAFLAITTVLLVADLKRPERFLYILLRPNPKSWLVRGSWILMGYGAVLTAWFACLALDLGSAAVRGMLTAAGCVLAALTAAYTGWLFGQAKGRVLWMRRGLWLHLIVQALAAGWAFAAVLAAADASPMDPGLRWGLLACLVAHTAFLIAEPRMAPRGREREYARAESLLHRGTLGRRRMALGIVGGVAVPAVLLAIAANPWLGAVAGVAVAVGLWVEEDALVRAGQALPIS